MFRRLVNAVQIGNGRSKIRKDIGAVNEVHRIAGNHPTTEAGIRVLAGCQSLS